MKRTLVIAVVAAVLLVGALAWLLLGRAGGRFSGETSDASVLLITIDTLRADRIGAYGHREATTPALDRLAAGGVLFENAITPAVMTLASHASILTGTWPPTHGIRGDGDYRLSDRALSLAEVLRARGFRTGAIIGSSLLGSRFGLDQGFEIYDDAFEPPERPARAVTDAAMRFLNRARGARFFLWVHYFDPHFPYRAPAPFRERHPGRPYDAEIAYVDSEIGRLLEELRSRGMAERTLVAVTADHGEGLGEHGEQAHGVFLYEEQIRVPLILWFAPHLPEGLRIRGVVRTVDIMPTILELIRIDPRQAAGPVQGESLWPMISDDASGTRGRPAWAEATAPLLKHDWSPLTMLRDDRYKYIEAPRPELYDMQADPDEKDDLAGSRADLAAEYLTRLKDLTRQATREGAVAETISPHPRAMSLPGASGGADLPDPGDQIAMLARIERVEQALGLGRLEEAAEVARAILAEVPQDDWVRLHLAESLARQRRFPEAIAEYKRILDRRPGDTEAIARLGRCLVELRRFDEAEAVYEQALRIDPRHLPVKALLGDLALERGDYGGAASIYRALLQEKPNQIHAILTMAGLYEASGKLEEAEVFYAHAADVDPANPETWMNLGWIRFRRGEHEKALEAIQRAQALAPGAPELTVAGADVLLAMGRTSEARAAYEKASRSVPTVAGASYGLGLIALGEGDAARAVGYIEEALRLSPSSAGWREDLARALAAIGRERAAAEQIEIYLASGQVPPDRRDELRRRMESYRRSGG